MDDNSKKIILDLCGGTGAWSKPYSKAGYDVRLITLPELDIRFYNPPKSVYGILAAPPCTEFSRAKGNSPRNYDKALEIVLACLKIIWQCRKSSRLKFWCLENPCGQLRQFLGRPCYSFQPWWFGDLWTKHTDLWGYFKDPKRLILARPIELSKVKHGKKGWYMNSPPKMVDQNERKLNRSIRRSVTPPGFSKAFFEANK